MDQEKWTADQSWRGIRSTITRTPNPQIDFVAAANRMAEFIAKVSPAIQLHQR